jgi:hypothetical protein
MRTDAILGGQGLEYHFGKGAGLVFLNNFVHLATICARRSSLPLNADRCCWENLPYFAPISLISAEGNFALPALGVTFVMSISSLD